MHWCLQMLVVMNKTCWSATSLRASLHSIETFCTQCTRVWIRVESMENLNLVTLWFLTPFINTLPTKDVSLRSFFAKLCAS
jgi:hypothetical protein